MAHRTLAWTAAPPPEVAGGAVTVGNFDGVHLAHRSLVGAARGWADRVGGPCVAVTFDPPPLALLNPGAAKPPLTTPDRRAELLHAAGADEVVTLLTDPGLLALGPEAFFEDVVVGTLAARAVVEGENFRFGRDRQGDARLLRALCAAGGLGFETAPTVVVGGEPVSSSRVRASLTAGDVRAAAGLLGRGYAVDGVVETGAKRGRTLGFPTANVGGIRTLVPKDGVYAVRATVDGVSHPAAANVGPAPTFGVTSRTVEVHLIGFRGDLYGRPLRVGFVGRLRDTRRFAGIEELRAQLQADVAAAVAVLGG